MTVAVQREMGSRHDVRIGHGGGPGDLPLRGSPFVKNAPASQYVAQAPEYATSQASAVNLEELLRKQLEEQAERARRRHSSLQPEVTHNTGALTLATASRDTGGSLHERRGRQF
ncbi:MAG TPA: hypothetical protein VEW42_03805 [Candidatus Eisenbacteria bacterium]|nr:hypothetical protein [Candidatus Eisenbacteria bacterium]